MNDEPMSREKFLEWENSFLRDEIKELKRGERLYRILATVAIAVYVIKTWFL
jgi:hypothetical protein